MSVKTKTEKKCSAKFSIFYQDRRYWARLYILPLQWLLLGQLASLLLELLALQNWGNPSQLDHCASEPSKMLQNLTLVVEVEPNKKSIHYGIYSCLVTIIFIVD